ncbi:MAG: threonine synthase [Planctomycetes bacterium]|nr:threonine synthase [Planctomycetota bacterium]
MHCYSTNRGAPLVDLGTALLAGQASDRGLYMPREIPSLAPAALARLADLSYAEVAEAILDPLIGPSIPRDELRRMVREAYDFPVPIEAVDERRSVLRLDRGPTASFKDFAAQFMARLMSWFLARAGRRALVLVATSGDTGGAVARAFAGRPAIRVAVLFPRAEVSERQRRQMTTLEAGVEAIAIDGKFDDCQALVKRAFADEDLDGLSLTSANSINIGRLLPQAVYYAFAWSRIAREGGPIIVSVPSGNFGNLTGCMIARRMGIPIERLIAATNENDEVPRFLATGTYEKVSPSRNCVSTAMNVGHPSNLARLVDLYGGWLDETGRMREMPDMQALRRDIASVSIGDDETRATIRRAYEERRLLLEPHGAVGWRALEILEPDPRSPAVVLETAHPAKFPDEIRALVGIEPELPPSLAGLDALPERYTELPAAYEPLKRYLRHRFGGIS